MRLISMTNFVLSQKTPDWLELCEFEENSYKIYNYAKFLSQPLEFYMFIPCDKDGNILEEPNENISNLGYKKQYQQAKDRCLFYGFKIVSRNFRGISYKFIQNKDAYIGFSEQLTNKWEKVNDYNKIEDLVFYNLPLTKNAIKIIGL